MLQLIAAAAAALLPGTALAHSAGSIGKPLDGFQALLFVLLAVSALAYVRGLAQLWRRAQPGRGITRAQAARFALGWLTLVAALASPLDGLSGRSFALHMVQHELLMVIAAPLLVTGRPLEAWTWALPPAWRRPLGAIARANLPRRAWSLLAEPAGAWTVHALALWIWHVPGFFEAALRSEALHVAQHLSFLGSALFFWWSVVARGSRPSEGWALASLFGTMLHTAALGALLTLAPSVWYAPYAATALPGLSPLEDQQLGGLVMWVPAGAVYIVAGLAIVASWLREGPREARLR